MSLIRPYLYLQSTVLYNCAVPGIPEPENMYYISDNALIGTASVVSHGKGLLKRLDVTFWLQVALLATAAASVQAAGWMESPPLVLIVFLAALTAALLVNLRVHRKVHHLWAILAGVLLAYTSGVFLTEADQWYLRFGELHSRLGQWWSVMVQEHSSTDTLPLSVTVIAITWVTAYFTSWSLFRHRNVWATFLLVGTATVLNLTYLPERYLIYIYIFLFVSLIMLVHMTSLSQRTLFQPRSTANPALIQRLSLAHGIWISVIILGITIMLPIRNSPIAPFSWIYNPLYGAADPLKGELNRVYSASTDRNATSIRFFGSVLPLVRPVATSNDPIMFAESSYPHYWTAIAYDEYTSKAWKVRDTVSRPAVYVPKEEITGGEDTLSIFGTDAYVVYMYVDSPYLLVAGDPVELDPEARQEIPASKVFQLDLADPDQNGDLPLGLQRLASTLAAANGAAENGEGGGLDVTRFPYNLLVLKVIKELSPSGGETTIEIETNSSFYYADLRRAFDSQGTIVGLEVVRLPLVNSPVLFRPTERLEEGDAYIVTSEFNLASEEALRNFPEEYPLGILERYLQIPNSMPERVSVLASDIVAGATNVYDKAVAIETYLRTLRYTGVAHTIAHDADAVDDFLFDSREGYSDYFASAMVMMLRTQGIPARLVSGFGPGEVDPEGHGFLVRDVDSHSWPEIYFSVAGWVPFEPTPIYEPRPRGRYLLESRVRDGFLDDLGGPLSGGEVSQALRVRHFGTPLGMGGALFALFLIVGAILMRILWMRQYGGLGSGQTAYERVHRLAMFLGSPALPSQTAFEFSNSLSMLIPEASEDVDLVSNSFVRQRYGGVGPTAVEELRLMWAWLHIKRAIMAQVRPSASVNHRREWDTERGSSRVHILRWRELLWGVDLP